jgi:hypothetical protein
VQTILRIKPHHFVDILTSLGQGRAFEPHPYGHAVHVVAGCLLAERDTMLQMEFGADEICGPCTHNKAGWCDDTIDTSWRPAAPSCKREWNLLLDERWCRRLGLAAGDRLTARQFCRLLRGRAGDLVEIYPEFPPDRIAARERDLAAGIERYLGE